MQHSARKVKVKEPKRAKAKARAKMEEAKAKDQAREAKERPVTTLTTVISGKTGIQVRIKPHGTPGILVKLQIDGTTSVGKGTQMH